MRQANQTVLRQTLQNWNTTTFEISLFFKIEGKVSTRFEEFEVDGHTNAENIYSEYLKIGRNIGLEKIQLHVKNGKKIKGNFWTN